MYVSGQLYNSVLKQRIMEGVTVLSWGLCLEYGYRREYVAPN